MILSKGILMGLITFLCWGFADFFAALSSKKIGEYKTLFWAQVTGLAFASIYFVFNFEPISISANDILTLFIIAILQLTAYLSFYKGLSEGLVSIVSPTGGSWVLITTILGIVFLHEPRPPHKIIAIALIIIGIIVASIDFKEIANIKDNLSKSGFIYGILAMFGWGVSLYLLAPIASEERLDWFIPVYIFRIIEIVLLFIILIIRREGFTGVFEKSTVLKLLPIGILDIAAFFTYSIGVGSEYVSVVAPISAAFPIITIMLAFIVLKEKVTISNLIGAVAIISGIVLLSV